MRRLTTPQLVSKTASLDCLVKQLKDLHVLNSQIDYYDHAKELKSRQLTIQALEAISAELGNIKKQLHNIKHKSSSRG